MGFDEVHVDSAAPGSANGHRGRVLVIAPQPFYSDRGTPIAVLYCAQALVQLGYAVDVATYPLGADPRLEGITCFRCANPLGFRHVPIGFSFRKAILDLPLVLKANQMLRERRYEFIHAVEEAVLPAVTLGARYRVPVIYDMQSSLPQQMTAFRFFRFRPVKAVLEACERWVVRRCRAVACSAGLAERVREIAPQANVLEWKFPSPVSAPIPGEAAALRASLGIREDARVVLYTGTFEPYQGLPNLVAAMSTVRSAVPGAVLVLVGAHQTKCLTGVTDGAAANAGVRVVPRQPYEKMGTYMSMADVLVSPRLYGDNVPLKVFDYLAAGRPIVATDIAPHRAVLDSSRAVLVPPRVPELGQAISRVLKDPELAERLSDSARGYAAETVTWNSFVERVDHLTRLALPPA